MSAGLDRSRSAREPDLEPVREAGVGEELLGLGQVLLVGFEVGVEAEGHGLTVVAVRSPRPLSTCLMVASMSTARLAACRTRLSWNGFGPERPAWSSWINAVRRIGDVVVRAWPDLLITSI